MSILPQSFRHSLDRLLKALVPAGSCLLCGADSGALPVCSDCRDDLPRLPAALCPQCAQPSSEGRHCGACLADPPHFDACHALFLYDFPADRLIQAFKYEHRLILGPWFAEQLAGHIQQQAIDCLIPLPLHASRLQERGFNQAMEIARRLENRLTIPVDRSSLVRARATAVQASLPHKERHGNVRSAFECRRDFSRQRILLIDDVLTTGATAGECARVLKLHGATRVEIAVIARAARH